MMFMDESKDQIASLFLIQEISQRAERHRRSNDVNEGAEEFQRTYSDVYHNPREEFFPAVLATRWSGSGGDYYGLQVTLVSR